MRFKKGDIVKLCKERDSYLGYNKISGRISDIERGVVIIVWDIPMKYHRFHQNHVRLVSRPE